MKPLEAQNPLWDQVTVESHTYKHLCPGAEELLFRNLTEEPALMQITIGPARLLLKFRGRRVALSLEKTEPFQEGRWYELKDAASFTATNSAFDRGQAKLELSDSRWQELREVNDCRDPEVSSFEIFSLAREFAEGMSDKLPRFLRGLSRRNYREKYTSRT